MVYGLAFQIATVLCLCVFLLYMMGRGDTQ